MRIGLLVVWVVVVVCGGGRWGCGVWVGGAGWWGLSGTAVTAVTVRVWRGGGGVTGNWWSIGVVHGREFVGA